MRVVIVIALTVLGFFAGLFASTVAAMAGASSTVDSLLFWAGILGGVAGGVVLARQTPTRRDERTERYHRREWR